MVHPVHWAAFCAWRGWRDRGRWDPAGGDRQRDWRRTPQPRPTTSLPLLWKCAIWQVSVRRSVGKCFRWSSKVAWSKGQSGGKGVVSCVHGPQTRIPESGWGDTSLAHTCTLKRESLTCFQVLLLFYQLGFQKSHRVTSKASCNRGKLSCLPSALPPQHFSTLISQMHQSRPPSPWPGMMHALFSGLPNPTCSSPGCRVVFWSTTCSDLSPVKSLFSK